jgi:hypothetical protein
MNLHINPCQEGAKRPKKSVHKLIFTAIAERKMVDGEVQKYRKVLRGRVVCEIT